jgi:hypothetical protein
MLISSGKSPIPELICRTYDGTMKKSILTPAIICAILASSACPSFAQYQGYAPGSTSNQNGASLNQNASTQFMAPNYWGDSSVKNRSTAAQPQSQSSPPMSGGRSKGGRGSMLGALMGPAMMASTMVMGRGMRGMGRGYGPHSPKHQKDDDEQKENRKQKKLSSRAAQHPSVNDENSLPDPLYPMQGMNSLSKKTLDLQNGNSQPANEEQKKNVYGAMQDDEGPPPGMSAASTPAPLSGSAFEATPGMGAAMSPANSAETAPGVDF